MRGPGAWTVALAATVLSLGPCIILCSEVFNLDVAAEQYAKETAMRHGSMVKWKDCWYNNTFMRQHKLYKPYQLLLQPGLFILEEPTTEVMQPKVVYKQTYVNNQSSDIRATFKQTREHAETTTITTTSGFECNISASMSVTVKKVVGLGGGLAANFLLHKTDTQTNTTTRTISVEMEITVPPYSKVDVEWHVTDIKKDFPWRMDIAVSGYCTIHYERPVLGHDLQFLPYLHIGTGSTAEIFNLDVAYHKYAKEQAAYHRVPLDWTDCWYNHSHMKARPLLSPYQITLQAGRFNLGEVKTSVQAPTAVYKHKYVNKQKNPIKASFKQSKTLAQTTSTSLINGFECNTTGSLTATIKKVVSIGAGFALNLYVHRTNTETNVTSKTIEVDVAINVPPQSEVTVEWQVTNIKKERSWTMDMMASGYCATYYGREVNGERLHFTPIKFVGYKDSRLTVLNSKHAGTVSYTSKGVLSSVETYEHNVVVTEVRYKGGAQGAHGKDPGKGKPSKPQNKHTNDVTY